MSELERLRKVVETNFRLNIIQNRELSIRVSQEMGLFSKEMAGFSERLDSVSRAVRVLGDKVEGLGSDFGNSLRENAERDQVTFDALRQILDNSVDLHKTVQDHERRLRRLEGLDEAS